MRVLVAPDSFGGTLTAVEAAEAIANGWRRQSPEDTIETCPLSDGGPGFLDVLESGLGATRREVEVRGPLGEPTTAALLLREDPDGVLTAYLETAQVIGLHLGAARALGARRVVVGLGGSATNDAGAGMLAALAEDAGLTGSTRFVERLTAGGGALGGVPAGDLTPLAALRARWADVDIRIASDVDSPLLGFHGASAGYAEQKGATAEQAQTLDRSLGDFAAAATRAVGLPPRLSAEPGAGAAGGLGFGLMLIGGRRSAGTDAVLDAVGLTERLGRQDLVVTGEGCFDWQSLRGKVIAGVARTAREAGVPVVVIAGQVQVGRREMTAVGVDAAYPVARGAEEVAASLAAPATRLSARSERVARTWSR
ncbi:MAG: glycerate kinase [Kineosporiaceae bacterium]